MDDFASEEGSVQIVAEGGVRRVARQEAPLRLLLAAEEGLQITGPRVGRIVGVDRAGINAFQYGGAHWLGSRQLSEQVPDDRILFFVQLV